MERRVLVTGGNSGIGLATVLHLAGRGFRVVGAARTPDKAAVIEEAAAQAGLDVETVVLDVADEAAAERVVPGLSLWGLVNNAGYMNVGMVEDVDMWTVRRQFETIAFGPLRLAQLALPAMRRRGDGRIVTVSSALAHASGPPLIGWYTAAKRALTAMTETLRIEVAPWGVDVVTIEPGGIRTPIWDKADADIERRRPTSRTPQAYDRGRQVLRALRPHMSDPRVVATTVGDALEAGRPRHVYRMGTAAWLPSVASRLVPAGARDRLARGLLSL